MRPIHFRRLAPGFATVVLFVLPSARASNVTIDLGTVAYGAQVNASIENLAFHSDTETYTYNQLLFTGPLSMTFDSGLTLAEVLAEDLGPPSNGTLTYNFPFTYGASGSYSENGSPSFNDVQPGTFFSFTATSNSGTVCAGSNNVGATISLDPTNAALTYATILGCDSPSIVTGGTLTSTTTTVTLTLGTITDGDNVTTYDGEGSDTVWQAQSGEVETAGITAVPEPSSLWPEVAAFVSLCAIGLRKRSG